MTSVADVPGDRHNRFARHVRVERGENPLQVQPEPIIIRQPLERFGIGHLQQPHRVVSAFLPGVAVNPLEERGGVRIPRPVKVGGQPPERLQ